MRALITGLVRRRSLYCSARAWHGVDAMTALREVRRGANLTQQELATLLDVPLNTFRMWDSGLRPTPPHLLERASLAMTEHSRDSELLSLDQLAVELGVHQRTLRAAARIGRLRVQFSIRSAFGRPIRLATRAAGHDFMRTHYRHYGRKGLDVPPLPSVPHDYDKRLKNLRRRLPDAGGAGASHWRRKQSGGVSVGVTPAQAIARLLATCGGAEWNEARRTPRSDFAETAGAPFESPPNRRIRTTRSRSVKTTRQLATSGEAR